MFRSLYRIHRFLAVHLFYPLFFSSILAVMIYVGRVVLSRSWLAYSVLPWNLFLAWIPYIFSLIAAGLHRLYPRGWWLQIVPGALWLLFFPNAAYIVTDFLHLTQRPLIPLWYDIILLATFSWTGFFLAVTSLRAMQWMVKSYLGWFIGWLFAGVCLGLNGLGIYLGRFERWNSWDLFVHPRRIIADLVLLLANPLDNLRFLGFTILITAFLLVVYLTVVSVRPIDEGRGTDPV
jgi:uncharacterized membrane protein